ncbi:LysM peptidoglycan-binding domain-containing protein [Psychrobacter sp. Ps3]|uniref:SPOR and LysM peptidoglycan-binding domain-containing protein n=1 Tax=Psychrobacter sp. Ps3 TaxID=2790957 RepID=UPI001EDC9F36|nr:LysM peptidoglycan-binding domain-containing protein [Psychrobacter sp. Ps3]MCG3881580.1 LysM peptidoglycan-binding domain-containing protein [Psychrobacter sp. Ps3]
MNFSRQALLGIGMIIGGSVMLYAMVQQIGTNDNTVAAPAIVETSAEEQQAVTPLTTDIETEKKLLAQKQKERALRVAEQEKRAEQFLAEQESAEAKALAKARAENQRYIDNAMPKAAEEEAIQETPTTSDTPAVQTQQDTVTPTSTSANAVSNDSRIEEEKRRAAEAKRAAEQEQQRAAQQKAEAEAREKAAAKEQAERKAAEQRAAEQKAAEQRAAEQRAAEKKAAEQKAQAAKSEPPSSPSEYKVKSGDGLIKLARRYNVPVEALAQANNTSPSATLQLGQTITIPSRKQIQRLEREAAEAERKREQEKAQAQAKRDAQQRLVEARREAKQTDAKGNFGVQVSLASDQAGADRVAKKFKDAGYQVTTSKTSRGVRVVVGPERGKVAALALKDKINNDPKVDTSGAWVKYW